MDPLNLNWTTATIEQYSEQYKAAIHVFSHDLSTSEAIERTIRFAIGRARWFKLQLPAGTTQGAWMDDRGQTLSETAKRRIRQELSPQFVSIVFMSEKAR